MWDKTGWNAQTLDIPKKMMHPYTTASKNKEVRFAEWSVLYGKSKVRIISQSSEKNEAVVAITG